MLVVWQYAGDASGSRSILFALLCLLLCFISVRNMVKLLSSAMRRLAVRGSAAAAAAAPRSSAAAPARSAASASAARLLGPRRTAHTTALVVAAPPSLSLLPGPCAAARHYSRHAAAAAAAGRPGVLHAAHPSSPSSATAAAASGPLPSPRRPSHRPPPPPPPPHPHQRQQRRAFHATPSSPQRDFYDILGVNRGADQKEIKKAYYAKAKAMHPDVNKDDPKATEKFAEVQSAYECLSDAEKRASYDQFGHAGAGGNPFGGGGGGGGGGPGGNPFGGQSAEDIFRNFGDMFGQQQRGGAGQMRNAPQRGGDVQTRLRVRFMDAVNGCKQDVTYRQATNCGTCSGTGAKPGTSPSVCARCRGTGAIHVQRGFFQMQMPCDACGGTGQVITDPCPTCGGEGRTTKIRTLQVTIPKGVDTGINMRLNQQGDEGIRGGPSGSLYVEIEVERDAFFERDGADVHTEIPIRFSQAALGATIPLRTLRGEVDLKVKAGTQPGEQVVLRGRGIQKLNGGERGNQYVHFHVDIPQSLTPEQQDLLERLEESFEPTGRYDDEEEEDDDDDDDEFMDDENASGDEQEGGAVGDGGSARRKARRSNRRKRRRGEDSGESDSSGLFGKLFS